MCDDSHGIDGIGARNVAVLQHKCWTLLSGWNDSLTPVVARLPFDGLHPLRPIAAACRGKSTRLARSAQLSVIPQFAIARSMGIFDTPVKRDKVGLCLNEIPGDPGSFLRAGQPEFSINIAIRESDVSDRRALGFWRQTSCRPATYSNS